jgi:hypothetical protein
MIGWLYVKKPLLPVDRIDISEILFLGFGIVPVSFDDKTNFIQFFFRGLFGEICRLWTEMLQQKSEKMKSYKSE